LNLPAAADLFSTQEDRDKAKLERIEEIPLDLIDTFEDHPFLVQMDAITLETIESVKRLGRVHTPTLVRPKADGRYELISGHRRRLACETAGLKTLPCIVREMDRDTAIITMRECNIQRENPLPSEKARAYKMWLDALDRQGQRTDLTLSPVATKLPKGARTADIVGEPYGDKKDSVYRYIALNDLIPELLQMVDNKEINLKGTLKMGMRSAVELAQLPEEEQRWVLDAIEMTACTPSHDQTIQMVRQHEKENLTQEVVAYIMQEEKPNQVEQFKLPREKLSRFFPEGTPAEKIEATIIKALELLERQQKRIREKNDRGRG